MFASADMNIRFLYTETSFCEAGQVYAVTMTGDAGFVMSQITGPL